MLAGGRQPRAEQRENVMLQAQLADSRGSREARISDVSSRGLLGNMAQPPARGEFVTIHFQSREVAGQVRWVEGRRFGVRLGEKIDAHSLMDGRNAKRRVGKKPEPVRIEEDASLISFVTVYSVLGLTALSTAYLIVTYLIF
ncbi:PilZ domain-containing protein [Aurantiacibacter odishensis]|uniref:PilZ domain-containing protein n=1 Tax=Aurantiacibacter odishensis TaxID=1155476 RepID=UPI000E71D063|nr:PilZ domain-containing protein [Aurantiacibacter odishensis]